MSLNGWWCEVLVSVWWTPLQQWLHIHQFIDMWTLPPQRRARGLQGGDASPEEAERERETKERRGEEGEQEEMSGRSFLLRFPCRQSTWRHCSPLCCPEGGQEAALLTPDLPGRIKMAAHELIITNSVQHQIKHVNKDGKNKQGPSSCLVTITMMAPVLLYSATNNMCSSDCY